MRAVLSVIAALAVTLVAAMLVVVIFPDRFAADLPGWARQWLMPDGPQLVLQIEPDGVELGQVVEDSVRIIKRRLDDLGVRAIVEKQEADRILVRLPGSVDVTRSIDIVTRRGKLELRLVDQTRTIQEAMAGWPPEGSEILYEGPDKMLPYFVEKRVLVSGRDLVEAQATYDVRTKEPVITLRFNANGARRFGRATQENVGRALAIVFDSAVLSAPIIREPILGGMAQISGNFTVEGANDMAIMLRAGALPGRLTVIETRAPSR